MADKISKIVLQYGVEGDKQTQDSLLKGAQAIEQFKAAAGDSKGVTALNAAFEAQRQRIGDARAELEKYKEDLETTTGDTDKATEATDGLAKATDRARDARGRFVAAGSGVGGGVDGADIGGEDLGGVGGGGSFASAQGLRRAGGAASQLGLTEIGRGLSIAGGVAQLDKFKASLSDLNPEVIAVGGGIAALTIAFDLYNKEQERTKALVLAEIDARQKALELLRIGSQQEIQVRINQLAAEKETLEKNAADAKNILAKGQQDIAASLGLQALGLEQVAAATGHATGAYQAAYDAANKSTDALDKNNTELDILTKNSGLAAQGINDIAQAAQNAAFIAGQITNQNSADLESYKAANFGTSKALQDRIRELQLELAVTGNSIAAGNDKVKQLGAETEAGKEASKSVAALITSYNATGTTLEALSKSFVAADIAAREAAANVVEANKDAADAVIKYNGEMTKNDEDAKKAQADIQQKYNDALVKAADANATAIENAYNKLQDTAAKLSTDFGRNNEAANRKAQETALTAQIHFQQDEAKAARDHANELLKIQQDEQNKEQDLIANRDFAGLFRARRDVTTQIQQSNTQYQQQEADRQAAFAQQNADAARQYAFEANERKIKYDLANQDAQAQYNKDLAAANAAEIKANAAAIKARDTQLKIEADKYKAQYDLLNRGIQNELLLYKAGQTARQQIIANEQAALNQSVALLAGTFRAALQFPGGNTTNNSGGNTTNSNNTITLNGGGPATPSQGIRAQVYSVLNEIIK